MCYPASILARRFFKGKRLMFLPCLFCVGQLGKLLTATGTSVDIPELGGMAITVDLDWTMEAVMNLMKNCMEHNPGGTIHCAYEQNPLYTEIRSGMKGRFREDMPYL